MPVRQHAWRSPSHGISCWQPTTTTRSTAFERLSPDHRYQRIRRLLIAAGKQGLCTEAEANEIHSEMRQLGFWDTVEPFPGS